MAKVNYVIQAKDDAGHKVERTYTVDAPASLLRPSPSREESALFLHKLCTVHHKRVLEGAPFRCVICGDKAEDLLHQPHSYLHLPQPQVIDMPTPICTKALCQTEARQAMAEVMRQVEDTIQQDIAHTEVLFCAACGKSESLRKCQNCMVTAYCSKQCQRAHWPQHKPACKQAPASRTADTHGSK